LRNANKILGRKSEAKRPVGTLRITIRGYLENNIMMDITEIWYTGVNRIQIVQDRVPWYGIMNTVTNHQVP
jgi:hypothetical protein